MVLEHANFALLNYWFRKQKTDVCYVTLKYHIPKRPLSIDLLNLFITGKRKPINPLNTQLSTTWLITLMIDLDTSMALNSRPSSAIHWPSIPRFTCARTVSKWQHKILWKFWYIYYKYLLITFRFFLFFLFTARFFVSFCFFVFVFFHFVFGYTCVHFALASLIGLLNGMKNIYICERSIQ